MDQSDITTKNQMGLSVREKATAILMFPLRLIRLPFDLVFLTFDFARLSLWGFRNLPAFFQGRHPRPYGPCSESGILENAGDESKWYCPLAAKYGTKSLLKILFSRLCWYQDSQGRRYLSWKGRRRSPPTSLPRYLSAALVLGLFWFCVCIALLWASWGKLPFAAPSRPVAEPVRGPAPLADLRDPAQAAQYSQRGLESERQGDLQAAREWYRKATRSDDSHADAFVGVGRTSLSLGLLNDAASAFQRALELDAARVDARLGLVRVLHREGHDERALNLLEEIEAEHADLSAVHVLKAKCLLNLGDISRAREAVDQALLPHEADVDVLEAAAEVDLQQGRLNDAERRYRSIVDIDAGYIPARIGIGRVLRLKKKLRDSESILTMLQSEHPGDPRVINELLNTLMAAAKHDQAFELCRETVEAYPELLDLRARLGGLALVLGRDNDVYNAAQDLLKRDPGNVIAHSQLATMYLRKGLSTLALEHADKAAAQNPNAENIYRLRVAALMANGDLAQAEERLKALLKALPGDLQTLLSLSECQQRQGHDEASLETLKLAVARHPDSVAVHSRLAQQLFQMARQQQAETHFRKAHELAPDNVKALNNLAAVINYNGGDLEEALKYAREAHRREPLNPQAADTLAWIHAARMDYDLALPLTAMAVAARSDLPNLQYHRGAVLAGAGQVEKAIPWLRKALASGVLFQGREDARALLESLTPGEETP